MPAAKRATRRREAARDASRMPCALAIGGLDPGGGAGILADVRAFEAAGVFGCAVAALLTVQSTSGMRSARAVDAREVVSAAREVLDAERVRAIKIGALGSRANVRAVAALLASRPDLPAIVDTPIHATRSAKAKRATTASARTDASARLLDRDAVDAIREVLVPRATLLTVNVAEAEALLGMTIAGVSAAHDAAVALCKLGAPAALVKGGHLSGAFAIDVLAIDPHAQPARADARPARCEVIELRARRLAIASTRGTGCTFASLVAGKLASAPEGRSSRRTSHTALVEAVRWAKRVHHAALARGRDVGGDAHVLVFR